MMELIKIINDTVVGCPLSAGINSAAVLCRLIELGVKPKELHIFYAHFEEHSPDSLRFVEELIKLAEGNFPVVKSKITYNSVIEFFGEQKMIPHPVASPCTRILKITPMLEYNMANGVEFDLIGYVKNETRRVDKQLAKNDNSLLHKLFPIREFDDEWCFGIVKKYLGWYPAIYDLRWNDEGFCDYVRANLHRFDEYTQRKLLKKIGTNKRVFKHNNCLPCKNMYTDDMLAVEYFYPEYMANANELSSKLKAYWGRSAMGYYTAFGREDYEATQCEHCQF